MMTMADKVSRWIREAESRGATALHLVPGTAPRARMGRELHPLGSDGNDTLPPGAPPVEIPTSDDVEAFARTVIPPDEFDTVLRRGQGEFGFESEDGRRHAVTFFRSREQWRATVLFVHTVAEGAAPRPAPPSPVQSNVGSAADETTPVNNQGFRS